MIKHPKRLRGGLRNAAGAPGAERARDGDKRAAATVYDRAAAGTRTAALGLRPEADNADELANNGGTHEEEAGFLFSRDIALAYGCDEETEWTTPLPALPSTTRPAASSAVAKANRSSFWERKPCGCTRGDRCPFFHC